jgi:hypothetical protein
MTDDDFIARLRSRRPNDDTVNFSALDFLYTQGTTLDALLYARLFWPEFTEFEGMVFRPEDLETPEDFERVTAALEKHANREEVEQSFNWIDVHQLFESRRDDSTPEEDRALARVLQQMWAARLQLQFPTREFVVDVLGEDETGGGPGVCFYERRAG